MRFIVVILYAFAQTMTSIGMNTLNPIATLLSEIYNEPVSIINLGGLLYILMHPFFTFPAAYVIDRKGVRSGIIVGSVLSLLGLSLRMLINNGFWIVIVGQVLAGIGRPFILNCQAKVSANWFRASKRVRRRLFRVVSRRYWLLSSMCLWSLAYWSQVSSSKSMILMEDRSKQSKKARKWPSNWWFLKPYSEPSATFPTSSSKRKNLQRLPPNRQMFKDSHLEL